jgi:hydroxyacylglutathione hydrolase
MQKIIGIPAFADNYIWALINTDVAKAVVVDPGDAELVIKFLAEQQLQLCGILLTHHHNDHTGGVSGILEYRSVPVFGPGLVTGTEVTVHEIELTLQVLAIPAHTLDHVAYYNKELLFCGDTLFTGGCGRVFEGTAQQMLAALDQLSTLPLHTKVYCGHEYTLNNLRFALEVEPDNQQLQQRFEAATLLREQNEPTVPSTIAEELATNPFLRTRHPQVIAAIEAHWQRSFTGDVAVFAALREWKNNWG